MLLRFVKTLALLISLFASVSALAAPPVRYENPQYHYSFTLPAGWENLKTPPPVIAFGGPSDHDFRVNFNFYSEPVLKIDLAKYVKLSKANIEKTKTLKLLSGKKTTLGGEPAYQLQSLLTLPGRAVVETRQVICLHRKRGFIFTYSALKLNYAKYDADFTKALSTFQWGK